MTMDFLTGNYVHLRELESYSPVASGGKLTIQRGPDWIVSVVV